MRVCGARMVRVGGVAVVSVGGANTLDTARGVGFSALAWAIILIAGFLHRTFTHVGVFDPSDGWESSMIASNETGDSNKEGRPVHATPNALTGATRHPGNPLIEEED